MALEQVARLVDKAARDSGILKAMQTDPGRLQKALALSEAHAQALLSAGAFTSNRTAFTTSNDEGGIEVLSDDAPLGTLLPPEGEGFAGSSELAPVIGAITSPTATPHAPKAAPHSNASPQAPPPSPKGAGSTPRATSPSPQSSSGSPSPRASSLQGSPSPQAPSLQGSPATQAPQASPALPGSSGPGPGVNQQDQYPGLQPGGPVEVAPLPKAQPTTVPQGTPPMPQGSATPIAGSSRVSGGGCCCACETGMVAIVAQVSTTAQTAITAITAIAGLN